MNELQEHFKKSGEEFDQIFKDDLIELGRDQEGQRTVSLKGKKYFKDFVLESQKETVKVVMEMVEVRTQGDIYVDDLTVVNKDWEKGYTKSLENLLKTLKESIV